MNKSFDEYAPEENPFDRFENEEEVAPDDLEPSPFSDEDVECGGQCPGCKGK